MMAWWRRVAFPVRRVWLAVAARVGSPKDGGGILKLRNDVQTCGYHDVQVMWEILRRSEMEMEMETEMDISRPHKRSFWRLPMWSSTRTNTSCASSVNKPYHH